MRAAGRRRAWLSLTRLGFLSLSGVVALLLGMSSGPPPDRKVAIPLYGTMCPDAPGSLTRSTWPEFTAYGGKARFGPVRPGSCVLVDGYTALTSLQLRCEFTAPQLSGVASLAPKAGGAAQCVVPPSQDFR